MVLASDWLGWVSDNSAVLWWLGAISIATLVLSAVTLPIMLARIPEDYFASEKRRDRMRTTRHPALRAFETVSKNVIGVVLVLAGIAMLVLPGQGVLTILMGLLLVNFPGRYRLERWLIGRPTVTRAVNWIRAKVQQPPLRLPGASEGRADESSGAVDGGAKPEQLHEDQTRNQARRED